MAMGPQKAWRAVHTYALLSVGGGWRGGGKGEAGSDK